MYTPARGKIFPLAITFLLILFLAIAPTVSAQEKTLVWDRFDVDVVVNPDSTFNVSEQQTIRFTQGSFTFGFRDIPVNNFDYIDQWTVTDQSGHTYYPANGGTQEYTFVVDDQGSHYVVHWYFPPVNNSTETYTLSYKVHNGLRIYQGGDQLWWKAIYADRTFPVLAGRIHVVVPQAAQIGQWAAYINSADARDSATATLAEGKHDILFELNRRLDAGEEFEVRVQFTHGVVDGVAPAWQAQADAEAAQRDAEAAFRQKWGPVATLGFGALGLLLIFSSPAILYGLWYRFGRDKPVEMVADYLPEPPDDLTPGMAGTLLDEKVDMQDIIATLVDLARRKAISITEEKQEGLFSSGTDFIYRRERTDVSLRPYEEKLLNGIFKGKDEVRLSKLKNKFYTLLPEINASMYQAVVEANLFPRNPETVRNFYAFLAIASLVVAVFIGIGLMSLFGDLTSAAILPGIGLGVTALGLLILSRSMPRKTDHGAEEAARWQAFKRYLTNMEKYTNLDEQKTIWDQWLPYAIAFGIERQYIRKFESVDAPAPGWYFPSPNVYGPHHGGYYGTPWHGPMASGGSMGGGQTGKGEGGGMGGGLAEASRGMGASLSSMSAGLGADRKSVV